MSWSWREGGGRGGGTDAGVVVVGVAVLEEEGSQWEGVEGGMEGGRGTDDEDVVRGDDGAGREGANTPDRSAGNCCCRHPQKAGGGWGDGANNEAGSADC